MKNTIKLIGIIALFAIIGFTFTACDLDDGSGDLKITGLAEWNGKYIVGVGFTEKDDVLVAAESVDNDKEILTGARISGGSVTLNVYSIDKNDNAVPFDGNAYAMFMFFISNSATITENSIGEPIGFAEVTLKGGDGSARIDTDFGDFMK